MSEETSRIVVWQTKLACIELCLRVKKCFGACHTMLRYLPAKKQVQFQGLDRWTYHTAVTRAQKNFVFGRMFFCANNPKIWQLSHHLSKVTVLDTEIRNFGWTWSSIQVYEHIFQIKDGQVFCRLIKHLGSSRFRAFQKAHIEQSRKGASYCNMADKFIFATGGSQVEDELSSVERYDIARDVWEEMPPINVARNGHGSCTLGSSVYIVCGYTDSCINSIEKLETLDLEAGWRLIHLGPTSLLTPRHSPVVAALNSSEILIMGGFANGYLVDVLTFDTRDYSETVQEASFTFESSNVCSIQVRSGVVVALIEDEDKIFNLIEYSNASLKVLH